MTINFDFENKRLGFFSLSGTVWAGSPEHIYFVLCWKFVEETEALFLLDGAKEISPHNDWTIPLLNNFQKFLIAIFLMHILAPPTINSTTSCETFVEKGKPETLTCAPAGHPTPNITWTKMGIIHDSNRFSLTITPEKTNKHSYECTADNGIGIPATRTFVVVVESEFLC